ncbi:MAG: hypothetical protein CSA49_00400 [Gammaproteobacteria bacterium]|nr:MAG: hypothetical protein CSA49_00400 [Gammaproteobacteria bacterium]
MPVNGHAVPNAIYFLKKIPVNQPMMPGVRFWKSRLLFLKKPAKIWKLPPGIWKRFPEFMVLLACGMVSI